MTDRRIHIRAAIDGLLLAVPFILLGLVMPKPLFRIAFDWIDAHPEAGLDVSSVMWGAFVLTMPLALVTARWLQPPWRMTQARLLLILAVTLLAIALKALDMSYD